MKCSDIVEIGKDESPSMESQNAKMDGDRQQKQAVRPRLKSKAL